MLPPCFLNIFKPPGMTSTRVVSQLKRTNRSQIKKIGHIGTLDPFASGVLIIGINGAQRLNDYLHLNNAKKYLAVGKLGVFTDTGDLTSEVIEKDDSDYLKHKISQFDVNFLNEFLQKKFIGEYWQSPHHYSAAKFEGKPLHEYARQGIKINKEKVKREIYSLVVKKYQFPYLAIEAEVSSGTYIRTLFNEIANSLGTIGTLVSLSRLCVGPFKLENTIKMKDWPQETASDNFSKLVSLPQALPVPEVTINPSDLKLLLNGNKLSETNLENAERILDSEFCFIRHEDKVMALSIRNGDEFKVRINFSQYYKITN